MLSLWKRKPEPVAKTIAQTTSEPAKRNCQQNIKVSKDCATHFVALAKAQGMSRAELFEDMVAARLEELQRSGMKVEITTS
ncbi:MAG: hypothetical protein WBP94_08185 [Rhodomicrobiaceae bacterium]